jgi:hypothetical protein
VEEQPGMYGPRTEKERGRDLLQQSLRRSTNSIAIVMACSLDFSSHTSTTTLWSRAYSSTAVPYSGTLRPALYMTRRTEIIYNVPKKKERPSFWYRDMVSDANNINPP